jgi:hypothetical protein
MKYFIKKSLKWLAFLVLTLLFFSLPVIIEKRDRGDDLQKEELLSDLTGGLSAAEFHFEFDPATVMSEVAGDSTSIRMITRTDTARKTIYLYVNGEKQDMIVVSDSMTAVFPRVYLKPGQNEILAVLSDVNGKSRATRKTRIFSQKKM